MEGGKFVKHNGLFWGISNDPIKLKERIRFSYKACIRPKHRIYRNFLGG